MSDTKCDVHSTRLETIEKRLERMEEDLDSIVAENHHRATELAVAERSFTLFHDIVTRLEARIETLERRIESLLKDRWQVLAGLLANGIIGATSISLSIWLIGIVMEYVNK
jgi:ubiquinone biosynthesis protein UbiJ